MSSKDQSERLVTNFFCPVCGRITWSGDEHKCQPPPYKAWIESNVVKELYAVCQEVAHEPYPDSDLASLLETLRIRAQVVLNKIEGREI